MVDNRAPEEFDRLLQSMDSAAGADNVNLDELLAQLNVEFPSDFDSDAAIKAQDQLQQETAPLEKPAPRFARQDQSTSPRRRETDNPPSPSRPREKSDGFVGTVSRHRKGINLALILVALLLAVGIAAVILIQTNGDPYGSKILPNVWIAGVDVGGMSQQEAVSAVSAAVGSSYARSDMTVVMAGQEFVLSASQAEPTLDIAQAVEAACAFGRTGSAAERQQAYHRAQQKPIDIPLDSCLRLNSEYIRSTVSDFIAQQAGEFVPSGYTLEGVRPALDADGFDESAPCQTLVLTMGHPGGSCDLEGILNLIYQGYSQRNFRVEIPLEYLPETPEPIDIDAIYDSIHVNPVEAVEGTNGSEGTPGSCGYTFNLEDARRQLSNATYGDVISIPMEYVVPQKLSSNGSFAYSLATFSTPVSSNDAYNENMQRMCQAINGVTLDAGASFSFNSLLNNRSAAAGYQLAPAHGDSCAEEEMAGGSDQVATTLYVAALSSGMTLVERYVAPHACSFATRGTEVTVSGWHDLKFRNPLDCTVLIRAKVTDSQVVIRLFSEADVDTEVKLETEVLGEFQPGTINVEKHISDGYKAQQVLMEGISGGQIRLDWITYKKDTNTEVSKRSEFVSVLPLNKAVVILTA